jgi:hypothetical protein
MDLMTFSPLGVIHNYLFFAFVTFTRFEWGMG